MKTFTGSNIEITDAIDSTLARLQVTGSTVQSSNGDPSPTNIRAITGVTKITVNGTDYPLPQPFYSLPNGTVDDYEVVGGAGVKRTRITVLSGTETFGFGAGETSTYYAVFYTALPRFLPRGSLQSSHFKNTTSWQAEGIQAIYQDRAYIFILKSRLTGWSDSWANAQKVSAFKSWLSDNPVTVLYELATPTAISSTPRVIPTQYPVTQITNDAGAQMVAVAPTRELPVCDRSQADIDDQTPKGYYNAADLNRIEQNCSYLAGALKVTISTRTWSRTDFPTPGDFVRILNNLDTLRAAYFMYQTTPPTPQNPINEYGKANDIEKILQDLHNLYVDNKRAVMYSGEPYAGQMIGVI